MDKNGVSPAIVVVVVIFVVVAGVGAYFVIRGRGETTWVEGLPVYPGAQQAEAEVENALTTAIGGSLPTERSIHVYKTSDDLETVAAWYGPQMSEAGWQQVGDTSIDFAQQISGRLLAFEKGTNRVVVGAITNPQYGNIIATAAWQNVELELPSGPELKPVVVNGTHFEVENRPFHFFGAFTFTELSDMVYFSSPYSLPWIYEPWQENYYEKAVNRYLASLVAENIHLIRFFSFGRYYARISDRDSPDWEKLDYLVKRCEYAGIRIIWVLWDRWDYGAEGATMEDYDYTADNRVLPAIVGALERWKDSPAIFAWEIMNEGDCLDWTPEKMENFKKWFADVSTHMKTIDNVHPIGTGFAGERVADLHFGGSAEDEQTFIDFYTSVHNIWAIDYISFHTYGGNPDLLLSPENFDNMWFERVGWFLDWIDNYRTTVNKPVILEEFGAARQIGESLRTQVYQYVIDRCAQKKMDATFNGWGADKTPRGVLIFSDDAALVALIRSTVATFENMT